MSMVTTDSQVNYLVQWFKEWSDLQRTDFLPILAENYAHGAYVNGIVNSISNMDCRDKPMSLFECRVKLFKEWFIQWNIEQKDYFLKKLGDIDPVFMEKLQAELKKTDIHTNQVNGNDEVEENEVS